MAPDFETYLSPFTWRYGSDEMRSIWSEAHKRRLWRRLWVALAETEGEFGLVRPEQVKDLRAHQDEVDMQRALEIESEIHHDLMAELKTFAEQSPVGGGIIHLGATSMDIEDNAEVLRIREASDRILAQLDILLGVFASQIETWAEAPLIAFTHLQPAEPLTLGYRLASWAQDLLADRQVLKSLRKDLKGKGFKGAVGSSAAYAELVGVENLAAFEERLSRQIDLPFFPIATQVYPRKQDYYLISALAGLGASLYKFAFDLRLLQSPPVGELSEPFGKKQVGSSAMPFKRNPIQAEKINSLGRALAQMPRIAWDNAAHSLLERTLDDSANRRTLLPEAFLIAEELIRVAIRLVRGLQVNEGALARNLAIYGPFAAVERVLMGLVRAGGDRQEMHELLRRHALQAWQAIQEGQPNPLVEQIARDPELQQYLNEAELMSLMDANQHLGDAAARARAFAESIRAAIAE